MNSESLPPDESPEVTPTLGDAADLQSQSSSAAHENFSLHIPPILLEGDDSEFAPVSEDVQKFSLGVAAPVEQLQTEGDLPESYGTQKLLLTARDPHWLYAHWDLTREQQHAYCEQSADGRLTLRVHREDLAEKPVAEIHVHPDARHWFVHVEQAGTHYHAQLGYQTSTGEWIPISASTTTATPPGRTSQNTTVEFATIPFETPLTNLLALAEGTSAQNLSLAEALEKLRILGHPDLPPLTSNKTWTADQERALAEIIFNPNQSLQTPLSSFTITENFHPLSESPTSPGGSFTSPESTSSPGGISSPFGGEQPAKQFWFKVNAELIVYGATEPTATVTIGGQPITLRPDGSFTFRFALPDGQYELPVLAVSADQTDGRAANLKFARATEASGDVGTHPQDPNLKPPAPENIQTEK